MYQSPCKFDECGLQRNWQTPNIVHQTVNEWIPTDYVCRIMNCQVGWLFLQKVAILYLAQQKCCQHLLRLELKLLKHVGNLFYYPLLSYPSKLSSSKYHSNYITIKVPLKHTKESICQYIYTVYDNTQITLKHSNELEFDTYFTALEKGFLI